MIGLTTDSVKEYLISLSNQKYDEPVPYFEQIDKQKLISALKSPFLRENPERNVLLTSARLFCHLIESHCASNANKRLAVVCLYSVLELNGYRLNVTGVRLYAVAMAVTWLSKYKLFEKAIEEVYDLLKNETEKSKEKIDQEFLSQMEKEFVEFMQGNDLVA